MGVAKVGGDTVVKAKVAPAVNEVFCCQVDHGRGTKVGVNGTAAVENRWQRQSGNNQLKVTVASSGVDSQGGGGKQRWSTAIGSKMPMAKAIVIVPLTPLLSLSADSGGQAAVVAARE